MKPDGILDPIAKARPAYEACLENAARLLDAANRLLLDPSHPNIAFHLSVLSLEEVGKSSLFLKAAMASAQDDEPPWIQKHMADHKKKLFHAIWSPVFGMGPLSANDLYQSQDFATYLHVTRLASIYVDAEDTGVSPWEQVTIEEAQNLCRLAKSRLELARSAEYTPLSVDQEDDIRWFFAAAEDKEKFQLIFGQKSMERLAELKNGRAWIRWVRDQFDEADRLGQARAEEELRKPIPTSEEAAKPKWSLRLRLVTNSHVVRAKPLKAWNARVNWIKLGYVNKKDELQVEFTLPSGVPVAAVYEAGFDLCKKFTAALNIGTSGFFWWYVPVHISRYYEDLTDLESREKIVMERRPGMALDWKKGVLTDQELSEVSLCFAMMPTPADGEDAHEPFVKYINGLAIMAKNDILLHAEGSAFVQFYQALKAAFRANDDWNGVEPFADAFVRVFGPHISNETAREYASYGVALETDHDSALPLTIAEVGAIKLACDFYFRRTLRRAAVARQERELLESTDGTSAEQP